MNDINFDVKGVKEGIESASEIYSFFNAEDKLQVRYPDCGHDFPQEIRLKAYSFIDETFEYNPD